QRPAVGDVERAAGAGVGAVAPEVAGRVAERLAARAVEVRAVALLVVHGLDRAVATVRRRAGDLRARAAAHVAGRVVRARLGAVGRAVVAGLGPVDDAVTAVGSYLVRDVRLA